VHRDTPELREIGVPFLSYGTYPAGSLRLDPQEPEALSSARFGEHVITSDDIVFADDDAPPVTTARTGRPRHRTESAAWCASAVKLSLQVGEDGEHAAVVLRRLSDPELGEGASDVRLDRLRAEPECATDSLVRAALGH